MLGRGVIVLELRQCRVGAIKKGHRFQTRDIKTKETE